MGNVEWFTKSPECGELGCIDGKPIESEWEISQDSQHCRCFVKSKGPTRPRQSLRSSSAATNSAVAWRHRSPMSSDLVVGIVDFRIVSSVLGPASSKLRDGAFRRPRQSLSFDVGSYKSMIAMSRLSWEFFSSRCKRFFVKLLHSSTHISIEHVSHRTLNFQFCTGSFEGNTHHCQRI